MNETKREKFIRIAENRMNNVLKGIELLSNLSNKSVYDYDKKDIDKMLKALNNAINNFENSFGINEKSNKFKF